MRTKRHRPAQTSQVCHVTAREVGGEHRARVYDAYGMVERLSIAVHEPDASVFAVNFYRHEHQRPFRDAQIARFGVIAPALLELARKQIALTRAAVKPAIWTAPQASSGALPSAPALRERLLQAHTGFSARELDFCVRLLQGMTQDGVAADLGPARANSEDLPQSRIRAAGHPFSQRAVRAGSGRTPTLS